MKRWARALLFLLIAVAALVAVGSRFPTTTHPWQASTLGTSSRSQALLAVIDQPGPLEVETVASGDWQVPLSGLVNLGSEKAKAAHLVDRDEPIQVFFHVIRHPTRGLFIVDTGLERALRDDPTHAALNGIVAKVAHADRMKVRVALADYLAHAPGPLAGVLLTHMHLDHVSGMPDVPKGTPLYAGLHEPDGRGLINLFTQGTADRALAGQAPVQVWQFQADPDGRFDGVIDVFGDGSLWALYVPGHTAGSTAYLARTPRGPVLMTGDTCHTVWGWENGVEPGSFTADQPRNAVQLQRLRALVQEHPAISVRLGHQAL